VNDEGAVADGRSMLDEICREGAQKMLAAALEAEVDAYVADLLSERGDNGRRLVTPQRPRPVAVDLDGRRCARDPSTARRRPPGRARDREEGEVHELARAAVVPQVAEGHRGVAAAVSARALDRGLRPCP